MHPEKHFTTDDPGPNGAEHMHFDGEAKKRARAVPPRGLVDAAIVLALILFCAASAMACQRLVEFNTQFSQELV